MRRSYHKTRSAALHRDMELLVFGHGGVPVLAFPTSMGTFYQWEDFGMVKALEPQLEDGLNQLFCVHSVDGESFYNRRAGGRSRIRRHLRYERYVMDEVMPFLEAENPQPFRIIAGTSLGGYHAANLAFQHPRKFGKLISLGGAFNIRQFLGRYRGPEVRACHPEEYVAGLEDPEALQALRALDIRLVVGENDFCRPSTEALAGVLASRNIPAALDIWGDGADHGWPAWTAMIRKHIA